MNAPPNVSSPCVRICALDEADVCVGCGRTLDEIARWSSMSSEDKARWWSERQNAPHDPIPSQGAS